MNKRSIILTATIAGSIVLALSASGAILMRRGNKVAVPAASEFGPGPRASARGLYIATLNLGGATLKPRKMYTIATTITDASGHEVADAAIEIGGGMPQHGHGFPTKPRVTKDLGSGRYEIGGLRFNMGGWWELTLTITTPAGTDTVTFNLSL